MPHNTAFCCRCFVNAVVQGLLRVPSIVTWLSDTAARGGDAQPVCNRLVQLLETVRGGQDGSIQELLLTLLNDQDTQHASSMGVVSRGLPSRVHLQSSDPQQAYSGLLALLVDKVSKAVPARSLHRRMRASPQAMK